MGFLIFVLSVVAFILTVIFLSPAVFYYFGAWRDYWDNKARKRRQDRLTRR